jgi:hypothetical protein
MGFFKKSRVKQEVAFSSSATQEQESQKKRLSHRQYKQQKKNDRKGNLNDYAAKKEERAGRIEALLEQRHAHRQGNTVNPSSPSYNPSTAPTQSAKRASDVGWSTASIATKKFFSFWN